MTDNPRDNSRADNPSWLSTAAFARVLDEEPTSLDAVTYRRIEIDHGRGWSVVAWRRIEMP